MISVSPSSFTKVEFRLDQIVPVVDEVQSRVGADTRLDGADVELVIDEDHPTARMAITSLDPIVFAMESGALEDTRTPREFGVEMASVSLASLFFEYLDRTSEVFGAPEIGEPSDLADKIAWSVYTHARVQRAGYRVHKPKHLYNFRNRHGFSDAADQAFEALWAGNDLTYAQILECCPPRS
jgi:hypothetical protein